MVGGASVDRDGRGFREPTLYSMLPHVIPEDTMRVPLIVPVLISFVAGAAAQDESAKPASRTPPELTKALGKASMHNQRVLAIFASEDRDLRAELEKDKAVSRKLRYEVEMVTLKGDAAHAFAVEWKLPHALQERPTLAVLDQAGKVLGSITPDKFLVDGKLDGGKLLPLLEPHFCAPVDAEQKLAVSLAEAKKSGRKVFVRFDAPW